MKENLNALHEDLPLFERHYKKLTVEHGLTDETIREAGLYSATPQTIDMLLNRNDILCDGIVIPHSDGLSRVRLDVPLVRKNGTEVRYLSPTGSENRLYVPASVKPLLNNPNFTLHITEGEFKALKLTQDNFPCIGIPGVWGFSSDMKLLPDFDLILLKNRKVKIILDSDARSKSYGE